MYVHYGIEGNLRFMLHACCFFLMKPSIAHLYLPMYIYVWMYRSSDGPIPTTKALSFRSQNGTVDRGASSQHMNMLQRIVSEQWYPAECRQRVPTAKSVMKTLSKSMHVHILCAHMHCTCMPN